MLRSLGPPLLPTPPSRLLLESRLLSPHRSVAVTSLSPVPKKKKEACHTGLSIWLKTDITAALAPPPPTPHFLPPPTPFSPYLPPASEGGGRRMRMETDFPFQAGKETMAFYLHSARRHGSSVPLYPVIHMRGRARQHAAARCLKALICVPWARHYRRIHIPSIYCYRPILYCKCLIKMMQHKRVLLPPGVRKRMSFALLIASLTDLDFFFLFQETCSFWNDETFLFFF